MIDLLSFLPYYLPIFFPAGAVVFRMFRVIRISRQTIIVMVKRNGTMLVPRGDLMLLVGDHVILYSQGRIPGAEEIHF